MSTQNWNILSTSTLSGDSVVNPQGKDLGDIKDFMVDVDTGEIVYAVLSFGGFLGVGDKLFAIPFEALQLDADNHRFMLDVDKEQLENAPGFDKNNWPGTPNNDFIDRVYTHYGYEPYTRRRRSVRTSMRQPALETA